MNGFCKNLQVSYELHINLQEISGMSQVFQQSFPVSSMPEYWFGGWWFGSTHVQTSFSQIIINFTPHRS